MQSEDNKNKEYAIAGCVIVVVAAIVIFLFVQFSTPAIDKPKEDYITVRIVQVNGIEAIGFGSTIVEYPDGTRKKMSGHYGKVGETFKIKKITLNF